jgi:DNA-binding HxlR family transcriptional regulator
MERDGIVSREIYRQIPPKVEYSLTPYGKTLRPLLEALCKWGGKHRARIRQQA